MNVSSPTHTIPNTVMEAFSNGYRRVTSEYTSTTSTVARTVTPAMAKMLEMWVSTGMAMTPSRPTMARGA